MKEKLIKYFMILITIVPTILVIISWIIGNNIEIKVVLTNIASILSVFSIAVGNNYSRKQEKITFSKAITKKYENYKMNEMENLITEYSQNEKDNILPPKSINNDSHMERNKQRSIMLYGIFILIGIEFIFTYFMKCSYLFVILICIESIIYMYLDYFAHVRRYAQKYDEKELQRNGKSQKSNTVRGLARIYLEEYKKTKFNPKDCFYKKEQKYCIECKRQIVRMAVDRSNNYAQVFGYILMFINIMFLFPETEVFLISIFDIFNWKLKSSMLYSIVYFLIIFLTMILNLYSLPNQKRIDVKQNLAFLTYLEDDRNFTKTYENEKQNISVLAICRGVFQYTIAQLDKPNIFIENISINNRMLYIHRAVTHVSRLQITVILSWIIIARILRELINSNYIYIIVLVVEVIMSIIIYLILKKYYLPCIGKNKIIKQCNILIEEEQEKLKSKKENKKRDV